MTTKDVVDTKFRVKISTCEETEALELLREFPMDDSAGNKDTGFVINTHPFVPWSGMVDNLV